MTFPHEIDNTIRSSFAVCPTQARYAYIEDLSPVAESVHLKAGAAFATGLEIMRRAYYEEGKTPAEALLAGEAALALDYGDFVPPELSPKTKANMVEGLRYYATVWPMENDSYRPRRMEWRFRVPIPGMVHPDDGGPIYYVGRPDTLGDIGTVAAIHDDKTASSLGKSWGKQWELDSQFTGYQWAAQELGELPKGGPGAVLIRGLSILTPKYTDIEVAPNTEGATVALKGRGKVKQEVWTLPVYNRMESFGHDQVLVYRPQWMIDRWLWQLQRDVKRMVYSYLTGEWDYALHKNACAAYGGCPYTLLCKSQEPEQWKAVNYVKRKWNPLTPL